MSPCSLDVLSGESSRSEIAGVWRAGQSLHEIGHAFGKNHSSIRCLVSHYGGFVPAVANSRKTRIRLVEALFDSSIPSLACMDFTEEHAS
jgi:hypothetical protein